MFCADGFTVLNVVVWESALVNHFSQVFTAPVRLRSCFALNKLFFNNQDKMEASFIHLI